MAFYEIVEKVIECLRREGRVGYRVLKQESTLREEGPTPEAVGA